MARFLAVLLVFCGVAGTAQAVSKPDRLTGITATDTQLLLQFEQIGTAVLAHIYMPKPSVSTGPVEPLIGTLLKVRQVGTDRYGRAIIIPTLSSGETLQEVLIKEGEAVVYSQEAFAQSKKWLALERQAERAERGMWESEHSSGWHMGLGLPVSVISEKSAGRFLIVVGRVTRSYRGRDMWYLNFGEDWKTDFSVRIPRRAWRSFGKNFTVADGACLAARGFVFVDNGPAIEVMRPEQLERLDANAC